MLRTHLFVKIGKGEKDNPTPQNTVQEDAHRLMNYSEFQFDRTHYLDKINVSTQLKTAASSTVCLWTG
ncbi:MAG: hypothetical protein RLZZ04_2412 [Cyanobacteriota bacterium]|jgi:hypothetical protein